MIMRNCCCCKVTTGSIILGGLTLISSALILIPLVGYLLDVDIDGLNVIQNNQKVMEKVLEDGLERHTWTTVGGVPIAYVPMCSRSLKDLLNLLSTWRSIPLVDLMISNKQGVAAGFNTGKWTETKQQPTHGQIHYNQHHAGHILFR